MIEYALQRKLMVLEHLAARDIRDRRVLDAFSKVPRELFVPAASANRAYSDRPLPIGVGQTISQPYMTAFMLQELALQGDERVLEIGTGSGYQTALLSELCKEVFTVERIPELVEKAKKVLDGMGVKNVEYLSADGTLGWSEHAPYDAIIASAGSPEFPGSYKKQVKVGGTVLVPVGTEFVQELIKVKRVASDKYESVTLADCVFVKLIGEQGWQNDR